jgi:hydrogenase maturation protein HypF
MAYKSSIKSTLPYSINQEQINIEWDFFNKDLATLFINTLAKIITDIAISKKRDVLLSGGVFQNKTLLELVCQKLEQNGIKYYYNKTIPINDSGISVGQIYNTINS